MTQATELQEFAKFLDTLGVVDKENFVVEAEVKGEMTTFTLCCKDHGNTLFNMKGRTVTIKMRDFAKLIVKGEAGHGRQATDPSEVVEAKCLFRTPKTRKLCGKTIKGTRKELGARKMHCDTHNK